MRTQLEIIGHLLERKNGTTCNEMIVNSGTTSPTRRLSDLRYQGWTIVGKWFTSYSLTDATVHRRYMRFYGQRPKE